MSRVSKSNVKRIRQNSKRRAENKTTLSTMKTQIKKFLTAAEEKADNLSELYRQTVRVIDKTASTGIIHKNNAANKKSKLSKKVTPSAESAKPAKVAKTAKIPKAEKTA
ncbi:MAG: 30S ribosomal protein S20 [Candidatus Wallbacteria bacterium]|nr:30S ribosomal protein S20 [Candidatus Wallbacteria bacterium]